MFNETTISIQFRIFVFTWCIFLCLWYNISIDQITPD